MKDEPVSNDSRTAGLILCGGRSSRMGGGDKCLSPLGQGTILSSVIQRIEPQVRRLAVSANGDPARFGAFGLPVLPDTLPGYQGPLAGILAGLRWCAAIDGCDTMLSAAGDTPFPPRDLLQMLGSAGARNSRQIAVAASGGRIHPVFALWPVAIADALEDFLTRTEDRRVTGFLEAAGFLVVDFPQSPPDDQPSDPFFNVNRPEDLVAAERIAEGVHT